MKCVNYKATEIQNLESNITLSFTEVQNQVHPVADPGLVRMEGKKHEISVVLLQPSFLSTIFTGEGMVTLKQRRDITTAGVSVAPKWTCAHQNNKNAFQ